MIMNRQSGETIKILKSVHAVKIGERAVKYFSTFVLSRKFIRMKLAYRFLKQPFFGPLRVTWKNPLSEQLREEWEKIRIKSRSGGEICAWFGKCTSPGVRATIVMGHPMGKEAKGYFIKNGYTDLLRANGYHVLVFDFNGFGESSHGNFSFDEDVLAAAAEASRQAPGLPVGYHGISLGGIAGIVALGSEHNCFEFAIIESAATSIEEFWVRFPGAHFSRKLLKLFLPVVRKKTRAIDRIREAQRTNSLLFIYSLSDNFTPAEMGRRLLRNSPVPGELWTVKDAGHAAIVKSRHREVYFKKILSFYNNPL
jgi:pimeloyl-ACP methyl ester carboxylesterase